MSNLKLSDSVEKIVRLDQDPQGNRIAVKIYSSADDTSRRTTKRMKPVERLIHQFVEAQAVVVDEYRARHRNSADKKKNGWFKDLATNVRKSTAKGRKQFKFKKIF